MYQEPYRLIRRTRVILLPVDGSKDSARAASVAFELAEITKGKLIILHVINLGMVQQIARMSDTDVDTVLERYRENGEHLLDCYKASAAEHDVDAQLILEEGLPSKMILSVADKEEVEVIIMGSHGASGERSSTIGSTTERVVRGAKCTVIVIKRPPPRRTKRRPTAKPGESSS
ncbi:MAG: universal stress protein [Candidatus Thorarchaeota archaeon]